MELDTLCIVLEWNLYIVLILIMIMMVHFIYIYAHIRSSNTDYNKYAYIKVRQNEIMFDTDLILKTHYNYKFTTTNHSSRLHIRWLNDCIKQDELVPLNYIYYQQLTENIKLPIWLLNKYI